MIYAHISTQRRSRLDLDLVVSELHKLGVEKSIRSVRAIYSHMASDGISGILSRHAVHIKNIWPIIYDVKAFLEANGLVRPPVDSVDEFYHIPALEDEHLIFKDMWGLFKRYEHQDLAKHETIAICSKYKAICPDFGTSILPMMLAREIWEQIERRFKGKPLGIPA
jgi:hypothetical protein